jgi:hypothetical protein
MEPLPRTTTGKIRRHEFSDACGPRASAEDEQAVADADAQWAAEPRIGTHSPRSRGASIAALCGRTQISNSISV